jgi:hypothetical protein
MNWFFRNFFYGKYVEEVISCYQVSDVAFLERHRLNDRTIDVGLRNDDRVCKRNKNRNDQNLFLALFYFFT